MGDMDLVRPLGLAGVDCVVAVPEGAAARFSRFTKTALEWTSPWERPTELLDTLQKFGQTQTERPVLFFENDGELLFVSRNRNELGRYFRFTLPDESLIEDLVDKARFQRLAERLSLPVPPSCRLSVDEQHDFAALKLRYPLVVKPLTRRPETWKTIAPSGKAIRVESPDALANLWPRIVVSGVHVLAQELIPGDETAIESYHVYVDRYGEIRGEFTGKKIRTHPVEFGDSTALETTNAHDVMRIGRELVKQLNLCGVAKFDFKRAPDGALYLLEVNPRFNLWHHLGAAAGVNLPALVFFDLTSASKQSVQRDAVAGKTWCRMWQDALAAKNSSVSMRRWFTWALRCDAKRLLSWDDPMPFVRGGLWKLQEKFMRTSKRNRSRVDVHLPAAVGVKTHAA